VLYEGYLKIYLTETFFKLKLNLHFLLSHDNNFYLQDFQNLVFLFIFFVDFSDKLSFVFLKKKKKKFRFCFSGLRGRVVAIRTLPKWRRSEIKFSNPKKLKISKIKHLRDSIWKRWYYLTHKMMWETNLKTLLVKTEEKQTGWLAKKMERRANVSSKWKSHSNDFLLEWQLDIFCWFFFILEFIFFGNFELPQSQSCGF
jgi:hypothetical protein